MKSRKKFIPEQIIAKLCDADFVLNTGKDIAAVLSSLEVYESNLAS